MWRVSRKIRRVASDLLQEVSRVCVEVDHVIQCVRHEDLAQGSEADGAGGHGEAQAVRLGLEPTLLAASQCVQVDVAVSRVTHQDLHTRDDAWLMDEIDTFLNKPPKNEKEKKKRIPMVAYKNVHTRTLKNMDIDLYIVMWVGKALLQRKVALRVGTWTSEVKSITPGLPQGSALSPVLFNVYTVGITSNRLEKPGRTLSFADDVLVYRNGKDRQLTSESIQLEMNRIDGWCQEKNGKINQEKATALWCSINNHAVNTVMPEVSISGETIKRVHSLRYLGFIFDRSLSDKEHFSKTIQRSRKG